MTQTRYWVISLLMVLVLIPISMNLINRNEIDQETINAGSPTYKSDFNDTVIYNIEGVLSYRLIAQHAEHFSNEGISWFIQPTMITFDRNKVPIWSIKSDVAKLMHNRILYLYGHVELNSLILNVQVRKIITDNAEINLVTQDMTSQNKVTLYGQRFNSSALKMRGNLRNKNAELFEKVITSYEIQNK